MQIFKKKWGKSKGNEGFGVLKLESTKKKAKINEKSENEGLLAQTIFPGFPLLESQLPQEFKWKIQRDQRESAINTS